MAAVGAPLSQAVVSGVRGGRRKIDAGSSASTSCESITLVPLTMWVFASSSAESNTSREAQVYASTAATASWMLAYFSLLRATPHILEFFRR